MVKITGADRHIRRLKGMAGQKAVQDVGEALFAGGEVIKAEAHISITTGAVSGKFHVPSRPGEPPSNDTGVLVSHINTIQTAPLRVEVESAAPYAVVLEVGSSKMVARPYMGPAAQKSRKEVTELVNAAVNRAIRSA